MRGVPNAVQQPPFQAAQRQQQLGMQPNMRGNPFHQQQQQQQQQQQLMRDEKLAQALQAHEYDRAAGGIGQRHGAIDPERQARHKARDEQLEMAFEVNPEAFVPVPMLYVACSVNDVPLKAFVDTGAQMTVMTAKCVQRCKLEQKVDPRFRGVAAGVGAARILGRVHLATVRFGSHTAVDCSITVLEQNHGPDLLLGLDLMRKYQAIVDLGRNAMLIGGKAIPFIEADQKEHHRR
jgi:hypothetical protein